MDVTLRQRRLIAAIGKLRAQRGLSATATAEAAGWSVAKLSRAESLKTRLNGDDVHHLCVNVFDLDQQATQALVELARKQRERGWWQLYGRNILGYAADLIELESDATSKKEFLIDLVPGLLQTAEYARALIGAYFPADDPTRIDERVEVRLARPKRLLNRELTLWVILDELALLRPIGGRAVMAGQLEYLVEMADHPAVTLQVLPRETESHPALGAPFRLYTVGTETYVHVDNLRGGSIEDAAEVSEYQAEVPDYQEAWQRLTALALPFDRSVELVRQAAATYRQPAEE